MTFAIIYLLLVVLLWALSVKLTLSGEGSRSAKFLNKWLPIFGSRYVICIVTTYGILSYIYDLSGT